MLVNPTSLTDGDRALIKEPFISRNSDNPAYYDTINEELVSQNFFINKTVAIDSIVFGYLCFSEITLLLTIPTYNKDALWIKTKGYPLIFQQHLHMEYISLS
jgi:hypothetical protein